MATSERYNRIKARMQAQRSTANQGEPAQRSDRYNQIKKRLQQGGLRTDVDEAYVDAFLQDAQAFVTKSQEEYAGLNWQKATSRDAQSARQSVSDDMTIRAGRVRTYLNANKNNMDSEDYNRLSTYLDDFSDFQERSSGAFRGSSAYFSQWDSEDAYNAHVAQQKEYESKVSFDIAAGKKEIAQLEQDLKMFRAATQWGSGSEAERQAEELRNKYGSPQELEKLIAQKQAYAKDAARIQKGIAMANIADPNSENYDPEFERYAQAGTAKLGTLMQDLKDFKLTTQYSAGGREDEQKAEELRGKYGSPQELEALIGRDLAELGDRMTEDEFALYGYHYAKNGPEAAQEYLDSIRETLNYRSAQEKFGSYEGKTGAELAFGVAAGLDQFGSNVKNLFNGDDYIPTSETQYLSSMVREDLKDNGPSLPEGLGGASLGQVAYDAINTTANMAPSILASMAIGTVSKTAGTSVGLGLMGASAAGGAYQEKLNLGYSKEQAGTYAAMVGASEMVLEKVLGGITKVGGNVLSKTALKGLSQVDNVLGRVASKVGNSAAGKILSSMGSEAIEEGLQTILEPVFWNVISGEEIDAKKEEVLYSALLGAVTGGVFEGAEVIPSALTDRNAAQRLANGAESDTFENVGSAPGSEMDAARAVSEASGANKKTALVGGTDETASVKAQIQNRQDELNAMDTVADVRIPDDFLQMDIASKQNWVIEKLRSTGYKVERKGFGVINFAKKQLKSAFNYFKKGGSEEAVFEALPYVLKNGVEISSRSNHKGRNYQTATIAAPVTVNGKRGNMAVVVKRTTDNFYKVHRILSPDGSVFELSETKAEAEPTPAGESPETGSLATPISSASDTNIHRSGEKVNSGVGEALLKSTGEAVGIMGVASVKDGTVRLKLEDGRIVDAGDVEHSSAEEALVYETATRLSDNALAANMLIENYTGELPALEYAKGIEEAWTAGEANAPRGVLDTMPFASRLAENQRWTAYKLGQIAAEKKNGAKQEPPQKPRKRGYVKTEGLTDAEIRNTLNKAQREAYSILNTIAKVTGVDVVLYRSSPDAKGALRSGTVDGIDVGTSQGLFSWKNDKIYIDINAGVLNASELGDVARYSMMRTFTHEFTHFMEKHNAEEWAILRDAVFSTMRRNGVDPEALIREHMGGHNGADRAAAESEVVAEAMVDILPESSFVEELVQKHRGVFETLLEKLKEFIQKIRNHFTSMGASRSAEPAAVKETVDGVLKYAEGLVELFDRVAVGAVENYQAQQTQKNAADGDKVQMQARTAGYDYSKSFAEQIDDYKTGKIPQRDTLVVGATPKLYNSIGFNALPMTINSTHVDYALNGTKDADHHLGETLLKQLPDKLKEPVAVFISQTKGNTSVVALLDFNLNGKQVVAPIVIDGFGVQNSLVIDSNAITSVYGKNTGIAQLYKAAQDEANGKFSLLYANKKEAISLLHRAGHQLSGSLIPHDGFYHSIREKNSPVKPKFDSVTETQQFKRWFGDWQRHPHNASKIVNADGTPKVMYHGSPTQFTVFDKKKAKSSGMYGKGFYFTDSTSHASTYGQRYDVYLNIRNPLEYGRSTVSRAQVRKFLEAVAENEDYSIENYGTYDVDAILKNILDDKTKIDAFQVLQDINATAIGDLVEATELFNKVNGTMFDGIVVPTETVAFYPEQIKSATDNIGTFDGSNPDIRYQDRVGTITNRDIIAESEGKTNLEREKIAEYQKLVNMSREQARIMVQRQNELTELEAAGESTRSEKYLEVLTEMNKAKNRMNNYEGQIRRMENGVLDPLINREKGRVLEKLRNTYGTIPKGEKAVRDDSLPVSTDGENRVSRTARTVKGAGVTPDDFAELIDTEVTKGGLTYLPISNDAATQKAIKRITREGWEEARVSWAQKVRSGMVSAELSATGALLLNNAARAGDRTAWLDILHDYQHMGTAAGQAVQALRILKQLLPDDKLYMAKRSISQMVADMHLGNEIEIDPELEKKYQNAKSEEEQNRLWDEITKNVAQQLPATFMDKWTALRYTNMLGNLRTQIRNLAGNVAMKGVSAAKNLLATGLENLAYQATGGKFRRTKSVTVSKDMRKAAKADFAEVEALVQGGGKYSTASAETARFATAVKEQQRIFKSKLLEGYRKGTSWAMEAGDLLFSRSAYARALAGYLKANGVNDSDFSKIDPELLNDARMYAVREAQEVTFRDTNALSNWISKIGRDEKTPKAAQWAIEGILPFRKTPANVLVRAEEYSPLGLINAAVLSIKAAGKDSEIAGAQVIESWAKALTGTGLFALGILLSSAGVLIGGPDDDDDLDYYEGLNGQQNYALKAGDVYITIDWLSPAAIPLFMGAQLQKAAQDKDIGIKDLGNALTAVADPMIEMSMLQGLNDAIDNVKYSGFTGGQFVIDAMTGYLTQALTNTLLGQIERGFEKTRMSTYVDKDSAMPNWMQKAIGKASARIPVLDYNQVPYINAWGEEEQNPKVLLNLIYNMLSPSYVSTGQEDAVSQELTRLNEVQSDVNVFPSTPEKKYDDRHLNSDEYVALAKTQGQIQRKIVEDMVDADLYAGLPDAYRAKAVEYAYKYARESAQINVLGREDFSSDWMTEIGENAADGILKHVIKENIKGMYLAGDITAEEAIKRRIEYHGDSRDKARGKIAYWSAQKSDPDAHLEDTWFTAYYEKIESSGIGIDAYMEYRTKKLGHTKKEDVLDVINGLSISVQQKDALYFAEGYPESTLRKAPWH